MPKLIDEAKVFAAAINILMSLGYDRATTRDIAELAGVNEVTLFRRYGSKAGLFEKAIAHLLQDTPLNKLAFTGDLEADLLAVIEAYVETNDTYGDIMLIILLELPRNPELQGSIHTPWNNVRRIVEIIATYQKRGMLRAEHPLHALSALVGPIMINQMFLRSSVDFPIPKIDLPAYLDGFLKGRRL